MPKRLIFYAYKLKILRFCTVGFSGLILNIIIFYFGNNVIGFNVNVSSVAAFSIASVNNYTLNTLWTFRTTGTPLSNRNYFKYLLSNLVGLGVNLLVLNVIVSAFGSDSAMLAQLLAVVSATLFNFILARKLIFRGV